MPPNVNNLVLFGAGASKGSEDGSHYVPALGPALFDALVEFDSDSWGAVLPQFAKGFRRDFEQGMREFSQARGGGETDVLQRAMAGYFFQFTPRRKSLYRKLACRIKQTGWRGALATLNYERLLELSLCIERLQARVEGLSNEPGDIELCLPHGCCHLFGQIKTKGNIILDQAISLDGPGIRVIDDPCDHAKELCESNVPPVMCYFQPDKKTRSGVSFINTQRERFAKLVSEAGVIAVVGLHVCPDDTHIWGPLSEANGKIVYCAGRDSDEQFRRWAHKAGRKGDEDLSTYWGKGFDAVCSAVGIMPVA